MKNPETVDEYINMLDGNVRSRMISIRKSIKKAFPNSTESMRYRMPAFYFNKTHVYFSACKNHIGMYPVTDLAFLEERVRTFRGKGTKDSLHFMHREELPLDLIMAIVTAKFKSL